MSEMGEGVARVADLLREAGELHHQVYRIVDGADPDWASWYADWLLHLSELPQVVQGTPVRSELIYMLVKLDREYQEKKPDEQWERYYASRLLEHFSHD